MSEDPKWELAILATVQGFYEKLLQECVGGEVPVPAGLEGISLQQGEGEVHATLDKMRRWLRLLDQAITPAMLRRAFTPDTDPEIAEAVLRHFTRLKDTSDVNRDKTDLVATFLYRHPRVPGQWERRGFGLDGSLPLSHSSDDFRFKESVEYPGWLSWPERLKRRNICTCSSDNEGASASARISISAISKGERGSEPSSPKPRRSHCPGTRGCR